MQIGQFHTLTILRDTSVGLYLSNGTDEVLLPNKYVDKNMEVGDEINVFIYLDQQERPVATTLNPYVTVNDFAYLKVNHINQYGAFLDWGLEKDLFVPFAEQNNKMEVNKRYLVYVFIDEQTNRLIASSKLQKFIDQTPAEFDDQEAVDLIIMNRTDLGYNVIINKKHKGLLFLNVSLNTLRPGDKHKGFIKQQRPDGKIDVVMHLLKTDAISEDAQVILNELKASDGFLGLQDKSSPEEIKTVLRMSKKAFKQAIGHLYKNKIIEIKTDGIYLT